MATDATENKAPSARVLRAFGVSGPLSLSEPTAWSPPILAQRWIHPPLLMSLDDPEAAGKESEDTRPSPAVPGGSPVTDGSPAAHEPEPGRTREERDGIQATGLEKAALLMVALGQDIAAEVTKHLSESELIGVTQAITRLGRVPGAQKDVVLEEFRIIALSGSLVDPSETEPISADETAAEIAGRRPRETARLMRTHYLGESTGGLEYAQGLLQKALGPGRSQQILERIATAPGRLAAFHRIEPVHLAPFIAKEHPQTIALILTQLEPNQAAGVLSILPEELQSDVTYRLATMENVPSDVLLEIEEGLTSELQAILSGQITAIGGPTKAAQLINITGRATEKAVLENLDKRDPELAERIRNRMFTFDDIAYLTDREIQMLLREVDVKDLAIALKGAGPGLHERILSNVSDRVAEAIKEQIEFAGPVRMSDVEVVQVRIVKAVRDLEEKGQVTITRGPIRDVFV